MHHAQTGAKDLAGGWAREPPTAPAKRSRRPEDSRELLRAEYSRHAWALDSQVTQKMDGRRWEFLNINDEYSQVSLAIRIGQRHKSVDVIDTIEKLLRVYPRPTHLRMDNGPELAAKAL